jgi:hypothetical protein
MPNGRLEAEITVPTGGWVFTMSVTGLGGTSDRTIAAGPYFPDELAAAFESELEAGEIALGGSDGFTVSISDGESGTGLLTVEHDVSVNFAISAWGSTDLRNALGFSGTLSGNRGYTASSVAAGVWISHSPHDSPRGADDGSTEADRSLQIGPRGQVSGLLYESRVKLGEVTWSNVLARYALESHEVTVGESFERWFRDTHQGRVSYFGAAPAVRLYWDADDNDYVEVRLTKPLTSYNPSRTDPTWIGLWPVTIDGYQVPA